MSIRSPRGLSEAEQAIWERLARTVTPLVTPVPSKPFGTPIKAAAPLLVTSSDPPPKPKGRVPALRPASAPPPAPRTIQGGLDSHWERRLRSGLVAPEYTLDLHGHTLDQAHRRLDVGLAQARALGARLVLIIAGKPRPVDAADRAHTRGAIRAKLIDWLAAGPHNSDIAAIRPAHRRYGGEGALYLVLKRPR